MELQWVDWFLSQPFSKYFVRIDDDYLNNIENYYGIRQKVSNFDSSYKTICGKYNFDDKLLKTSKDCFNECVLILYGHLHSRFILTDRGLELMFEKYKMNCFESCPRTFCNQIMCIPYGISNDFGESAIKMFCPNCNHIYFVKNEDCNAIDGACFGNSWVHLFLQKYNKIVPEKKPKIYIPRLFGYQLYGDTTKVEEEEEEEEEEECK